MPLSLTFPAGGALVVGGTGNVGQGIVRQMARAGVPTLFTYRGSDGASEARAEALEHDVRAEGGQVQRLRLDFSDDTAIQGAIEAVKTMAGRLHSVFCAGGPHVRFCRMADFSSTEVDTFIRNDAIAIFRLTIAAVQEMRRTGGGTITICTTMANDRVLDFNGLSAMSKAAVEAMLRQIAAEEGLNGIRCNTVGVAWISEKPMAEVLARLDPPPAQPRTEAEMSAHLLFSHGRNTRVGRNAKPDEAGAAFAYLASDQAGYITGQCLLFDGGVTL